MTDQGGAKRRTALVTGAGRGIGRFIALQLAKAGFDLCLAARTREELEQTRRLSGLPPSRSLIVLADLAESESAGALIGAMLDHYGTIDVLVNNAGWAPPRSALARTPAADLERMIAVNLRAPIALTRLAAAAMIERGTGAVINIASRAGRRGRGGEAVYAATKAGLIAFTHACFEELRGRGIKLSVIVPGLVDTALIPPNKRVDRALMLAPADVAGGCHAGAERPARRLPARTGARSPARPRAAPPAALNPRQALPGESAGVQSLWR